MSKKELNDNEIEKVSGGINSTQPFIIVEDSYPNTIIDPRKTEILYGGPNPRIRDKILKRIRKEQNKDKEKPEKGKLPEE